MKKINNFSLILIIVLLSIIISQVLKIGLNTNELLNNFYSEQFAKEQIDKIIENQEKLIWLGYLFLPILILLRTGLVALCLSVGTFFYYINDKEIEDDSQPKFKQFFRVALLGEFVLLFVSVFKLIYFVFIQTDYSLTDLQQYFPLSLINLIDIDTLDPWLIYPIQSINLFEIVYFFVLVYGLWKLLKNKYWRSFEMVVVSYGLGLAIWISLVMFLTLNMS